jgi:hypothetical protein
MMINTMIITMITPIDGRPFLIILSPLAVEKDTRGSARLFRSRAECLT